MNPNKQPTFQTFACAQPRTGSLKMKIARIAVGVIAASGSNKRGRGGLLTSVEGFVPVSLKISTYIPTLSKPGFSSAVMPLPIAEQRAAAKLATVLKERRKTRATAMKLDATRADTDVRAPSTRTI